MIHFVSMPFGLFLQPSYALALFKSQLDDAEIDSKIFYFNIEFAASIGFAQYDSILNNPVTFPLGEWLFAAQAWGRAPVVDELELFFKACRLEHAKTDQFAQQMEIINTLRTVMVPEFLENCIKQLGGEKDLRIIGFSCNHQQTMASLALGRILKKRIPGIQLVYGGPAFHGDLGLELIAKCRWIDVVSIGESDGIIVDLFTALMNEKHPGLMQGIYYRDSHGNICGDGNAAPVDRDTLNSLPIGDFSDYMKYVDKHGLLADKRWSKDLSLPFEISRGCWWGRRKTCRFCGMLRNRKKYVVKSAILVKKTLEYYKDNYPISNYSACDNILPGWVYNRLLPDLNLKKNGLRVNLAVAETPRLNRQQIKTSAQAGVGFIGPGIESFSTNLLRLMRKQTTALQNVFFLKCCRQYGIDVSYSLLYRIPGERQQDYSYIEEMIPKIYHLSAPFRAIKIICQRHSSYFEDKTGRFLIKKQPMAWYRALYPEDEIELSRIAVFYNAQWRNVLPDASYHKVLRLVKTWQGLYQINGSKVPQLTEKRCPKGNVIIEDSRCGSLTVHRLTAEQSTVYNSVSSPISINQVMAECAPMGKHPTRAQIKIILSDLMSQQLVIEDNGMYLSLGVPAMS